jgi:hypothetical protein
MGELKKPEWDIIWQTLSFKAKETQHEPSEPRQNQKRKKKEQLFSVLGCQGWGWSNSD